MIEILVVRDPDSANDIRVWLDGRELHHVSDHDGSGEFVVWDVDAGAGWQYQDWVDTAGQAAAAFHSERAKQAVVAAYADPPGKQYIDDWPEDS